MYTKQDITAAYNVLGLQMSSSQEEVGKKYQELKKKEVAVDKYHNINNAKKTLDWYYQNQDKISFSVDSNTSELQNKTIEFLTNPARGIHQLTQEEAISEISSLTQEQVELLKKHYDNGMRGDFIRPLQTSLSSPELHADAMEILSIFTSNEVRSSNQHSLTQQSLFAQKKSTDRSESMSSQQAICI